MVLPLSEIIKVLLRFLPPLLLKTWPEEAANDVPIVSFLGRAISTYLSQSSLGHFSELDALDKLALFNCFQCQYEILI